MKLILQELYIYLIYTHTFNHKIYITRSKNIYGYVVFTNINEFSYNVKIINYHISVQEPFTVKYITVMCILDICNHRRHMVTGYHHNNRLHKLGFMYFTFIVKLCKTIIELYF